MKKLELPRGQRVKLGISPTHWYRLRHRIRRPSAKLALTLKKANPEIAMADILGEDHEIIEICQILAREGVITLNQGGSNHGRISK